MDGGAKDISRLLEDLLFFGMVNSNCLYTVPAPMWHDILWKILTDVILPAVVGIIGWCVGKLQEAEKNKGRGFQRREELVSCLGQMLPILSRCLGSFVRVNKEALELQKAASNSRRHLPSISEKLLFSQLDTLVSRAMELGAHYHHLVPVNEALHVLEPLVERIERVNNLLNMAETRPADPASRFRTELMKITASTNENGDAYLTLKKQYEDLDSIHRLEVAALKADKGRPWWRRMLGGE